jgi:hypothetical protein
VALGDLPQVPVSDGDRALVRGKSVSNVVPESCNKKGEQCMLKRHSHFRRVLASNHWVRKGMLHCV